MDHPETLVKFCRADNAQAILSQQTLRWSAPHLFHDPFEPTFETNLNFDPQDLLQAAIQAMTAMIFAKEAPRGSNNPLFNAVRRWREEERFDSPDEAEDVLKELLSTMVDQRLKLIDQIMTDWRKYARTLRIASFSAKPNNIAAWERFADRHRGVAIRFQCGEFTALPQPKPVEYRPSRPEITTLREQLGSLLGTESVHAQDHFEEKFTSKSPAHRDEQEWRCFSHADEALSAASTDPASHYNDRKFERGDVTAVYFGVYARKEDKQALYDVVKAKYAQAKIFQAKAVPGKYEIEFERITGK